MERFLPLITMGMLFLVLLILLKIEATRQALIGMWRRGGFSRRLAQLFIAVPMGI